MDSRTKIDYLHFVAFLFSTRIARCKTLAEKNKETDTNGATNIQNTNNPSSQNDSK